VTAGPGRRVRLRVAQPLRFLLSARYRHDPIVVPADESTSLVHVVETLGIPRTEIGELRVDAEGVVEVPALSRPQRLARPRFVLDVHLGTLARRMRLLGLDTAYRNDATDPQLVAQAAAEGRVVLTQDRGILRRKALAPGSGYVRGSDPDAQLRDVLERYDPPLAPWSRCLACNGILEAVTEPEVRHLLREGTRRSYREFSRCRSCGHPYWRGAHAGRLAAIVAQATGRT